LIEPRLLDILACPACRAAIRAAGEDALCCTGCGRRYPIRDGIPILLVDAAEGGPDVPGDDDGSGA
jgi:uncharacterized protein YbaR (Trm112 family)